MSAAKNARRIETTGNRFERQHNGKTYVINRSADGWACSNGYTYSSLSAASRDIAGVLGGPHWWGAREGMFQAKRVERVAKPAAPVKPSATPPDEVLLATPAPAAPKPATMPVRELTELKDIAEFYRVQQSIADQAKVRLRQALEAQLAALK